MPRKLPVWIGVCFGVVLALTLYLSQENLREDWNDFMESIDIHKDNFMYTLSPERSKSLSMMEKEQNLKLYAGQPFIDFRQSDWDKFWGILYGVYPVDYSENERLPARARQLNRIEMEEKLKDWYPAPFGNFQQQHWQQFWELALGKKA